MRIAFSLLLAIHGAIHAMGFVKAFGLAEIARLGGPITRPIGALWLAAALGYLASAVLALVGRRYFWAAALPALVLSQIAIISSWSDARFGTIVNAIVVVPLALSLLDLRPSSLRSRYSDEVNRQLARSSPAALVTDADLAPLPTLVQAYLRRVGVVGRPHVRNFRAVFRAAMRASAQARWMSATAEQYNFYDQPARLFFMEATRSGIPFDVFHRYAGAAATMQVRVAGLVEVVNVNGHEMTQSETVTLLNDTCILAPAALLDAAVTWQPVDGRRVKATFSNAGHTVSAVLSFDDHGDLVGFVSDDRYQSDGKTHRRFPWSTPVGGYRDFGGLRLPADGEVRWREPGGEWAYGRFQLQRIDYNVGTR